MRKQKGSLEKEWHACFANSRRFWVENKWLIVLFLNLNTWTTEVLHFRTTRGSNFHCIWKIESLVVKNMFIVHNMIQHFLLAIHSAKYCWLIVNIYLNLSKREMYPMYLVTQSAQCLFGNGLMLEATENIYKFTFFKYVIFSII